MKKLFLLFLILTLAAAFLSCGKETPPQNDPEPLTSDPLAVFAERMERANSFEAVTVFSSDALSKDFTLTYRKHGNIRYLATAPEESEQYFEEDGDGKTTVFRREKDGWISETVTDGNAEAALFSVFFAPENYDKQENGYEMKNGALPDGYTAVTLLPTEDGCCIRCRLTHDGKALNAEITVGRIDKVQLSLPAVS